MREFRPVATAEAATAEAAAAELRAAGTNVPDGGPSAMDALVKAGEISRRGVALRSRPGFAVGPVDRIDLAGLTAAAPLHHPSVTGAAACRPGDHVGGAMLPPPVNTVALSDGTRISFGAVEEVPVRDYA